MKNKLKWNGSYHLEIRDWSARTKNFLPLLKSIVCNCCEKETELSFSFFLFSFFILVRCWQVKIRGKKVQTKNCEAVNWVSGNALSLNFQKYFLRICIENKKKKNAWMSFKWKINESFERKSWRNGHVVITDIYIYISLI